MTEIGITTNVTTVDRPSLRAVHLDEEIENNFGPVYIYCWESEWGERREQLIERCNDLRSQYIFATGIEYVEPLRELVPLEPEQLTVYVWLCQLYPKTVREVESSEKLARMLYDGQTELN